MPVAAAVAITAAVTGLAAWGVLRRVEAPIVSRLQMMLPPGQPFYFNGRHLVAISPDGRQVAVAGFDGFVRLFDAETGAMTKEFSPAPLTPPQTAAK